MANRDINVNVTFCSNGVLDDLHKWHQNRNSEYFKDKENVDSILPKKELYHVDLSKPIGIIIGNYLYGIEFDEEED